MRRFGMMLGLLWGVGCATATRGIATQYNPETGRYETPTHEVVYQVPAEDAMMTARYILEKSRYDVMEKEGGLEMYSSFIPDVIPPERYYIQGKRLGPRQALVRVFRIRYTQEGGGYTAEVPGQSGVHLSVPGAFSNIPGLEGYRPAHGYRDLGIEQKLLERLEMAPALELVGGNSPVPIRSVVMESWGEKGGTTATSTAPACGVPVAGASSLFSAGGVLLVADPLGTQEVPSAALRMLCEASAQELPVTLALSIPVSEQPLLDSYLASDGDSAAVQELLSGSAFWRRAYQDGRSSRAMLWLVEQARRLRVSGKDVDVAAIDSDSAHGNEREAQMAQHLLNAQSKRPQAWTLVLTGSVHARTTEVSWDGDFEPMGSRVVRALPSVRALDVGFQRGTQFACRYSVWDEELECNVFGISPTIEARQSSKQAVGLQLFTSHQPHGFHGRLYLGALSASPPALHAPRQDTTVDPVPATK
ncbi:hypothetical protein BHS09_08535 [Myxococcus xanthus]|uniref:Lipoprotein n=1 Tax=Myxococcus xanthus TaxID=34 RepID=A0AAE6FXF8_MYXXA|nr:hypothetical protein [Myxococcus xanthus]QDE67053.1 hypothetical protein BHS09_08535 [Myxococcus xanthus]QDE74327.1 hypothetical protein BHS08_08545 [Myxococcus xanthus]